MVFDLDMIKKFYDGYADKLQAARKVVNHPLTLTEKILYTHLWNGNADTGFMKEEKIMLILRRTA